MPCYRVGNAIICTRGHRLDPPPCRICGRPAPLLCDYPLAGQKTCDAPLCRDCAVEVGPDRHF